MSLTRTMLPSSEKRRASSCWCCAAYHALASLSLLSDDERVRIQKKLAEASAHLRAELVSAIATSVDARACGRFEVVSAEKRLLPKHLLPNAPKGGFPDEIRLRQLPPAGGGGGG